MKRKTGWDWNGNKSSNENSQRIISDDIGKAFGIGSVVTVLIKIAESAINTWERLGCQYHNSFSTI